MLERIGRIARPEDSARRRLLWALLATACFSLLANGYAYFNFYPLHDAVDFTIGGPSGHWQTRLGRFLVPLYMAVKGPVSTPWLTGLAGMLYLGLSVFIITELLGQRSGLEIALTGGFLSANLFTLEANTAQQYFSGVFLFALLFSCLGAYCVFRGSGWKGLPAAAACFVISFGMYQAFITTAACLCALAGLREMALGEAGSRRVLKRLALGFAVLAASGAVYLLLSRLAIRLIGKEPSDASWSIYTAGRHSPAELWKAMRSNYEVFVRIFFDGRGYVGRAFGLATCLLAAMALVLAVRAFRRRKGVLLLLALLALAFPLVSRLVNVFTGMNGAFRTMFAQFLIWPICVALIFWSLPKGLRARTAVIAVTSLLSLAIIAGNIRNNNGAFTVQRVLNERAIYHVGRVLEDLEDFDTSKRLAIIGKLSVDSPREALLQRYSYVNGFGESTGADSSLAFVKYANLMGYKLRWKEKYRRRVWKLKEVKAMPAYPEPGYILETDKYVVVRLSE